ncbi:hypothetical protein N9Y89_00220 [bacterium]|nr:hypothetical protein [bacterium]
MTSIHLSIYLHFLYVLIKYSQVSVINDLKVYAISRIFMDNFSHIKAYWPMIGRNTAQENVYLGSEIIARFRSYVDDYQVWKCFLECAENGEGCAAS